VLLVVVPFLNEAAYLPGLLASVAQQTLRPDRLLLVDDGSHDGSAEVCEAFCLEHPEARLLRRPPRPPELDRLATASELRAFTWALEQASDDWTMAVKLDADLVLPPRHFELVVDAMRRDPGIGIAGAFLSMEVAPGRIVREGHPDTHVRGPNKFYRRACWEAVAPIPPILGWDTIDEATARMHGWATRSIALPGGDPLHRRPTGTHDGALRGFMRWGHCAYAAGSPPSLIAAGAVRRMSRRPRVLGGMAYAVGWGRAAARRVPRASPAVRRHYRAEEWSRALKPWRMLARRLASVGSRAAPARR
jgi:poly-beta-1,6-N-acetyl-D-glucosamine synthase